MSKPSPEHPLDRESRRMLQQLALVAAAGAVGTLARYGLATLVSRWAPGGFPWGTVVVNLSGCFLFGLIWSLAEERGAIGSQARLAALTGFMGAFTTYSTFAFESARLIEQGRWPMALGNIALQNIAGLGAVFVGMAVARGFRLDG